MQKVDQQVVDAMLSHIAVPGVWFRGLKMNNSFLASVKKMKGKGKKKPKPLY